MTENELSRIIVDSAFKIHASLGAAFSNRCTRPCSHSNWKNAAARVICQQAIPVIHESVRLDLGFRADLIVNREVVIEAKSVEAVAVHAKQLRTYLRLMDLRLGLLINFNVNLIKDGIQRVVNNL